MAWVSHEDIVELDTQGLTARQIAERLGISMRTVQRVRVETGRAQGPGGRPPYTPEFMHLVEQHLNEGWSILEIARTYGVSNHNLGRRFPGRGWTRQQIIEHSALVRKLQPKEGAAACPMRTDVGSAKSAASHTS